MFAIFLHKDKIILMNFKHFADIQILSDIVSDILDTC